MIHFQGFFQENKLDILSRCNQIMLREKKEKNTYCAIKWNSPTRKNNKALNIDKATGLNTPEKVLKVLPFEVSFKLPNSVYPSREASRFWVFEVNHLKRSMKDFLEGINCSTSVSIITTGAEPSCWMLAEPGVGDFVSILAEKTVQISKMRDENTFYEVNRLLLKYKEGE